jgi:hypothetical protein
MAHLLLHYRIEVSIVLDMEREEQRSPRIGIHSLELLVHFDWVNQTNVLTIKKASVSEGSNFYS